MSHLSEKDNAVMIALVQRKFSHCDTWYWFNFSHWICYICGRAFTDHQSHGIKHLEEMNLDSFR